MEDTIDLNSLAEVLKINRILWSGARLLESMDHKG